MRYLPFFFCIALIILSGLTPAEARSAAEEEAAKETYIPGLRLLPTANSGGLRMAYVEEDASPGGGRYHCGALTSKQAENAAGIAGEAFALLPESAWNRIDLNYLLLCSEAKANGRIIGGIPVPPLKLLMLSAGTQPSRSLRYPYTLLHELYHLIEMQYGFYQDSAWNSRFKGYANSYGAAAGSTAIGSGGVGFVNSYGKSFPYEERAELFATLVLAEPTLSRYISDRQDVQLGQKRDYLLRRCREMLGSAACR